MLDKARLRALRLVKNLDQSRLPGLTQNQVSNCEKHGTDSIRLLILLATALDCTEGFLLGKSYPNLRVDVAGDVRMAASRMAFDVFRDRHSTTEIDSQRCARVLGHPTAPITADGWAALAEQIALAVTPPEGGSFRAFDGGKAVSRP
jgi:hypothetical protein